MKPTPAIEPDVAVPCFRPSDPVELLLARIARRTLMGTFVTGVGTLTACGAIDDVPIGRDPSTVAEAQTQPVDGDAGVAKKGLPIPVGATPVTCTPKGYPLVDVGAFRTALDFDSLELRLQSVSPFPARWDVGTGWTTTDFDVLSQIGTRCKTATQDACGAQVANHPARVLEPRCDDWACREYSVVTTAGDDVRRWASDADVAVLLGTTDTAHEALFHVLRSRYYLPCSEAERLAVVEVPDGFEVYAVEIAGSCSPVARHHVRVRVGLDGSVTPIERVAIESLTNVGCVGRMPDGYARAPQRADDVDPLGAHLAACAELEAASVHAFEQLVRELEAHGAPAALIDRARRSRDDEVRHAEVVAALARARGCAPHTPAFAPVHVRSLEHVARENAVEGCVRETLGAVVGLFQAARAEAPDVRGAMGVIAPDELRHAALSHDVHAWIMPRLDDAARARITAAQRAAIDALWHTAAAQGTWTRAAGLPARGELRAMIAGLSCSLWSTAVGNA